MTEYETILGRDLTTLIDRLDDRLVHVESIIALQRPADYQQACFRLHFESGRLLKGRRLKSEVRANIVFQLSSLLDRKYFSRALMQHGHALIEEWIPGEQFNSGDIGPDFCFQAGQVLGELSVSPVPDAITDQDEGMTILPERHQEKLAVLEQAGIISGKEADQLSQLSFLDAPSCQTMALVHGDYCLENMIQTSEGGFHIIDNESLCLSAPERSLARCFGRWPMLSEQREALLDGFRQFRPIDSFLEHEKSWSIWTTTISVYVRYQYEIDAPEQQQRLRELASGRMNAFWPVVN